ncbi:MAG TPA: peptidyl-prolyl cis-trans isomerase [Kiritimatiellia bacterium]|nr:peptidyl-prolyl cis-trans isomerase [Kiritimatiellia bacterium]HRU70168.1 peptidyl-prolyl cis-trans isomerase [Kiritimatiellia bacterium]
MTSTTWLTRNMKNTLLFFTLIFLAGCSRDSARAPGAPSSPVLAMVGGRAITQADFDAEVARRRTGAADVDPETVLNQLIERQAMLIKAEASGIATNAEFRRETENRLISHWLSGTLHKDREAVEVTEKELEEAYETRKETAFRQGAQVRFAILYRKGRNIEELKAALAEAVAVFAKDRDGVTQKGRLTGFGTVAAEHSEDTVSRYRGGDLGWFDADKPESPRVPQEVLATGAALETGAISAPIVAGGGVYVIMKSGSRDAKQLAFKEAAPFLRRRLLSEKRDAVDAAFKTGLLADVKIELKQKPVFEPLPAKPAQPPPLAGGPQ